MIGLVCAIATLIVLMIAVTLVSPWVGFVVDRYIDWCVKVQAKWKR